MNIFVVDKDPVISAESLHNAHVRKMLIESSQLLGNAFPEAILKKAPMTQDKRYRKHTHYNHPCSKWTRESILNWRWLLRHNLALCLEFKFRFNKTHYTERFVRWLANHRFALNLPNINMTKFAMAMPDQYKSDNPIESYRQYYIHEKLNLQGSKWTKRKPPRWLTQYIK